VIDVVIIIVHLLLPEKMNLRFKEMRYNKKKQQTFIQGKIKQ